MVQTDVLTVLAANLENRLDCRINGGRRPCLGSDLVPHHIAAHKIGGEVAPRAGGTDALHRNRRAHFGPNGVQTLAHRVKRLARRGQIAPRHDAPVGVNQGHVGADRTHINAQIDRQRSRRRR